MLEKVEQLRKIADNRDQSMAQLAIAWVLRKPEVTSALIGASKTSQINDAVGALDKLEFDSVELDEIDDILEN